jgi:hypothetical protein
VVKIGLRLVLLSKIIHFRESFLPRISRERVGPRKLLSIRFVEENQRVAGGKIKKYDLFAPVFCIRSRFVCKSFPLRFLRSLRLNPLLLKESPCIFQNNVIIPYSMKSEIITLGKAGSGSRRFAGDPPACIPAGVPPAEFAGPASSSRFPSRKIKPNQTKSK